MSEAALGREGRTNPCRSRPRTSSETLSWASVAPVRLRVTQSKCSRPCVGPANGADSLRAPPAPLAGLSL